MAALARVALVCALALMLGLNRPAQAATTIAVTTQQDGLEVDGNCTLREAIESANSGLQFDQCGPGTHAEALPTNEKVIAVPAGSYFFSLTGADEDANQTGDLDINASVSIRGAGAASTRISANILDRVFDIGPTAAQTVTVALSGLTIEDGLPPAGGDGGGIRALRATLTLENCEVSNNRLTGASLPPPATPDIASGAGIYFGGGELTIVDSLIHNNRTSFGSGGGIYNDGTADGLNGNSVVNISGSTISQNRAEIASGTGSAGGIGNLGGRLNIANSAIRDNFADGQAGGLLNFFSFGVVNIANSTISGNTTNGSGGGIRNIGAMYLTHVTVVGNTADFDAGAANGSGGGAGGIRNNGFLQIRSSIVFGNRDRAGDAEVEQYPDIHDTGVLTSTGHLMLGVITGTTTIADGLNGDLVGVDPQLQPPTGDPLFFPLPLASPALHRIPAEECTFISSGGNSLFAAGAPVTRDQAGNARPDPETGRCDVGAHEPGYFQLAVPLVLQP